MNQQKFFTYIIVYFLLLFKAGFFFVASFARYTNVFLLVLAFLYLLAFNRNINKSTVLFTGVTLFCETVTFVIHGFPEFELYLSCVVNLLLVVLIVSSIGWEQFKGVFSNLNYIICIVSLFCFLLHFVGLPLYQVCPLLINSHGEGGYFALFSIPRFEFSEWATYRIQGIYWEPGAFQFFIIVSAIIDLYDTILTETKRTVRVLVYFLTIILTFSTTGIIAGLLVVFLYVYKSRKKTIIPLALYITIIVLIVAYGVIDENTYLYYTLFGKLSSVGDSYYYGFSSNDSAEMRWNSFVYVLDEFIKSPIVGMGQSGNEDLARRGVTMTTFTPLNLFAFYGFLVGLIHLIGFFFVMRLKAKPLFEALLIFGIITLSTVSEQFAFNPILMCFSAYGYVTCNSYRRSVIKKNHF